MEEKFYHPEKHIYSNDEEHLNMEVKEVQDSRLFAADLRRQSAGKISGSSESIISV